MKAVAYETSLPVSDPNALIDIDLPVPVVSGRDLLIRVKAVSVNPVDCKIRKRVSPEKGEYRILGWDAVGEVAAVGDKASLFSVGDAVFYAGDLNRQGSNAEYQTVDERLVGRKPDTLTDAESAAMPLTTITAWELLFERLGMKDSRSVTDEIDRDVLLITGASGGVGSILVQLAKQMTNASVIATASRDSSREWVESLGADVVIDHSRPLTPQIHALNMEITHIASLTHTDRYFDSYVDVIKPMGKIAVIDDPGPLDIGKLKSKSLSLHWEFMFTRSMYQTDDMTAQHYLLNEVACLIEKGVIKTTLAQHAGKITAANLRDAHALIESGRAIGKIVLEGFDNS